jgi:hypothetical protein
VAGGALARACTAPPVWRVALATAALLLALVAGARAASATAAGGGGGLVVVGVDGGTWRVMDPLLARGELPTVARIQREGAHGILWSMQPSVSPLLWTTIATGRLPMEHGVHGFYRRQNDDLKAARFWEIAAAHGARVGIFQWLVTWPPDALPGFIVPGWLARDARTQPPSLSWIKTLELRGQHHEMPTAGELAHGGMQALHDGLRFASLVSATRDGAVAWRLADARASHRAGRFVQAALVGDVFLGHWRRERPGVSAVVFYGTDALSHAYWRYYEPDADVPPAEVAEYGDAINEYYRRVDAFLGRLLDTVGPETTVLVVSDHGFKGAQERAVALGSSKILRAFEASRDFVAQAVDRQVYVTHRHPGTQEALQDVAQLARRAAAVTIDGQPLMEVRVDPGTSVTLELRPGMDDLDPGTRFEVESRVLRVGDLVTGTSWSGSHEEAGILMAHGPRIRPGLRADASIRDVTPTILALLGLPVADDMDGRVVDELFTAAPAVARVASYDDVVPRRQSTAGGDVDDDVEERLRALGYVR